MRIAFGDLVEVPSELVAGDGEVADLVDFDPEISSEFKVIYAMGRLA